MTRTDPEVEARARAQVAHDEARITGPARRSLSLGQVFVEFWRHPSPYLLGTCLTGSVAGRVSLWIASVAGSAIIINVRSDRMLSGLIRLFPQHTTSTLSDATTNRVPLRLS